MGEGLYFISECARKAGVIAAIGPAGYHYRTDNPRSATSVPSVMKMRNALHAISEIEQIWRGGGREIQLALAYHRLWTLFGALVDAVVCRDPQGIREFLGAIHASDPLIALKVHGKLSRRTKALAIRAAPLTMARIAAIRRKHASKEQV